MVLLAYNGDGFGLDSCQRDKPQCSAVQAVVLIITQYVNAVGN